MKSALLHGAAPPHRASRLRFKFKGLALALAFAALLSAAQAQTQNFFGGTRGPSMNRPPTMPFPSRVPDRPLFGEPWTRPPPLRLRPIREVPTEEVIEEEVERPVRRRPRIIVVDEDPAPRREPPRKVAKPKVAAAPKPMPQAATPQPVAKKIKAARLQPPAPPPKPPRQLARPLPGPALPAVAGAGTLFVPDEVLFEIRGREMPSSVADIARRHRLQRIASERFDLMGSTVHRYRIQDRRSVPSVLRALAGDARVAAAQPNFMFRLADSAATGALSAAQYALAKMHLPEAHRLASGRDVVVAVIDSGIDRSHPELAASVTDSFDAIGGTAKPHAHGTGIAGVIGSRAQLTGVAPRAKLLAARTFSGEGGKPGAEGTSFHILRGIEWAHRQGARVVNMSFAGPSDALLSRMLAAGRDKGIVFVAAAGNQGPQSQPLYPAADPNVIAVTASDNADRLYPAANRGAHICVAAPGVEVLVAAPSGAYGFSSGTSMAAAHVSGAVALLLEAKPDLKPHQVRDLLARSAKDLGPAGSDPEFGAGLADAFALVSGSQARPAAAAKTLPAETGEPSSQAPAEAAEVNAAAVVAGEVRPGLQPGTAETSAR